MQAVYNRASGAALPTASLPSASSSPLCSTLDRTSTLTPAPSLRGATPAACNTTWWGRWRPTTGTGLSSSNSWGQQRKSWSSFYHSFSLNKILFPAGPLRSTSRLALAAAPTPWPLNTSLSCRTLPWRTFTATTDLTSWHWDTTLGISSRTGRGWTRETLTCDHFMLSVSPRPYSRILTAKSN